jgi:hypothetical protein
MSKRGYLSMASPFEGGAPGPGPLHDTAAITALLAHARALDELVPAAEIRYAARDGARIPCDAVWRPLDHAYWHPSSLHFVAPPLSLVVPVRPWRVAPGLHEIATAEPSCGALAACFTLRVSVGAAPALAIVHCPQIGPVVAFISDCLDADAEHCFVAAMLARFVRWSDVPRGNRGAWRRLGYGYGTRRTPLLGAAATFPDAYAFCMGYVAGTPSGLYGGSALTASGDVSLWKTFCAAYPEAPRDTAPTNVLRACLGRAPGATGVYEVQAIIGALLLTQGIDHALGLLHQLRAEVTKGDGAWTHGPTAASDIDSLILRIALFGGYAIVQERNLTITVAAAAPHAHSGAAGAAAI